LLIRRRQAAAEKSLTAEEPVMLDQLRRKRNAHGDQAPTSLRQGHLYRKPHSWPYVIVYP
jgi:hypothetical protein